VICDVAGAIPSGPAAGIKMGVGDWLISDGTNWIHLAVGGAVTTASQVGVAPPVFGATNVQTALENAQTAVDACVLRMGDTMTGMLVLFADPVVPMDAATKQYVDNTVASIPPPNGYPGGSAGSRCERRGGSTGGHRHLAREQGQPGGRHHDQHPRARRRSRGRDGCRHQAVRGCDGLCRCAVRHHLGTPVLQTINNMFAMKNGNPVTPVHQSSGIRRRGSRWMRRPNSM
jgi:hypothetical protein